MSTEFSCTASDQNLALYEVKLLSDSFLKHVVGEVILDNSCPEEPPDFIFEDSDFCPNVADIKVQAKEFKVHYMY